jgi:putative lipoic acid-binding regulatory protein
MNQETNPPSLLEFPCKFPVKVMGLASEDFSTFVLELAQQTFADARLVGTRPSGQGKYLAVTIEITATSRESLDNLYRSLTSQPRILMAL